MGCEPPMNLVQPSLLRFIQLHIGNIMEQCCKLTDIDISLFPFRDIQCKLPHPVNMPPVMSAGI
ncbi:hypothetical protein D3C81_2119270 [compost metagenome]